MASQQNEFPTDKSSKFSWSTDIHGLENETAQILQKYGRPKTRSRSMKRIDYTSSKHKTVKRNNDAAKLEKTTPSPYVKDTCIEEKRDHAAKKIQNFFLSKAKSHHIDSLQAAKQNAQLRLFSEDGSVNLSLRAVVADALKTHRFDNVPSILLHEHFGHNDQSSTCRRSDEVQKQNRFYSEEKKLVSNISFTADDSMKNVRSKRGKHDTTKANQEDLISIRNVPYPGMDSAPNNNIHSAGKDQTNKEVCFNCWSAYKNSQCNLRNNINETKGGNLPFCDKWGIRHLRQCYRCEDLEERYSMDLTTLRFAKDSRRRSTMSSGTQESHPIYKSLLEHVTKVNLRARRRFHISQWLSSFMNSLKLNLVDVDHNFECGKKLREKGTKKNILFLKSRVHEIRDSIPQAPTSFTDINEESMVKTIKVLSEGGLVEKKLFIPVMPIPKAQALYMPKKYEIPPVVKVRLNGDDEGVELFGFFGKKRTGNNMAIGGFSGEVIMMQRLLHYTPPEYGDFNILETTTIAPPTLPESYVPPNTLKIEPKKLDYVERELQHPLNHRRPPTITLKVGISDDERHYFGTNRPEQTGETGDKGFRTSESSKPPPVEDEIKTTPFVPSSDVVSPNTPRQLPPMTTTTGLDYPFCETPSRQNTIEDLAYILKTNQPCTFNKPQTFTVITKQEPGKFMCKSDPSLPLGRLRTIVTRSWSFLQKRRIARFTTRNGVPYWYDRQAGRTFWERPICKEENLPVKEGGVFLGSRENNYLEGAIDFNDAITSRSTVRKLILSQTDIGPKRKRPKGVSPTYSSMEEVNDQKDKERPEFQSATPKQIDLNFVETEAIESNNSSHSTNEQASTNSSQISADEGLNTNLVTVASLNDELHDSSHDSSSALDEDTTTMDPNTISSPPSSSVLQKTNLQPTNSMNSTQLVSSIADALGGMLKDFSNETDVLKLGVGLGLSLSAQGILNIEDEGNVNCQVPTTNSVKTNDSNDTTLGDKNEHLEEEIIFPTTYEDNDEKDPIERIHEDVGDQKDIQQVDHRQHIETSDFDPPLKAAFKTHQICNTEGIISYDHTDNDENEGLERVSKQISPGFLDAINCTRVGKQHVEYLPSNPNLPQCIPVGRVKPRSAGKDWLAIGFDPWSAGKEMLSIEFVPFLVGSEETNNIIPLAAPKDSVSFLSRENKENETINKKFKQLSSFIRHGNYSDFELTLEEFGDSFPIDTTDDVGNTLLMVSCQNGNKRMVKLCLRKGSDINKQNTNGHTSLHYAFGYGFGDLGAYLISKGADDNIANAEGLTCYEGLRMEDISSL